MPFIAESKGVISFTKVKNIVYCKEIPICAWLIKKGRKFLSVVEIRHLRMFFTRLPLSFMMSMAVKRVA